MSANHNDRSQTSGESTFNSLGLETLPPLENLGLHAPCSLSTSACSPPPVFPSPPSLPPRPQPRHRLLSRNLFHTLDFRGFDNSVTMVEILFS